MPTAQAAGVELAYEERGTGRSVLLVHGMADDRRGWHAEAAALAAEARVVAYDRRGYGASEAPEPYERTSISEQTEDAAALLNALDAAPAVAVGRDFGTLVCLELAIRHAGLLAGAVLVAPALYALLPGAGDDLAAQRVALGEALIDRGPAEAVAAYLAGAPPERVERARAAHRAFFADYGGLPTFGAGRRELAAIETPLVVLDGRPGTLEAMVAERLAALIPHAARHAGADVVSAVRSLLR